MADFAQVVTIDWGAYSVVLQKRIFQLDDRTRAKFRIKAGQHLGRPAKEDLDAGLADPWDGGQAGVSSEIK